MSDNQLTQLIRMANQIADNQFCADDQPQQAVDAIAGHIKRFWARSMKQQIIGYNSEDGADLSPLAKQAIEQLAASQA